MKYGETQGMKGSDNLGELADPLPGEDPNIGVRLDQGHLDVCDGRLALRGVFAAQLSGGGRHAAAGAAKLRVREELGERGAVKLVRARVLRVGLELLRGDFGVLLVDELVFLGFQRL